jgi:hypothetical protein
VSCQRVSNGYYLSRRDFVKTAGAAGLVIGGVYTVSATASEPMTDIGTPRELFVGNTLVSTDEIDSALTIMD